MAEDEVDPSELFSSPIKPSDLPTRPETPKTPKTPKTPTPTNQKQPFDAEEVREAQLRRELQGVRNINDVIEGVIGSLERAKGNMGTVSQTVNNASTLLNTWTRILSQTEHNQRLILNQNWKGTTQDLHDIEAEAVARQQAAERKAAEEERRREDLGRKAEERERARLAGTGSAGGRASGTRGARGTRGRGILRGGNGNGSANTSGYGGTSSSSVGSRSGSHIGRGLGASRSTRGTRGAGRGVR